MKLEVLFLCSVIGVGLAIFLERFLQPNGVRPAILATPDPTLTLTLTGDPVRDYMNRYY